jgi:O-antigen ligase
MILTCAIVSVIGIATIPGGGRVSAPFEGEVGEPNTFGGYLVFMIAIVVGLMGSSPYSQKRLIYAFLLFLFAIPLFYTQSRSSYLAAVPALLSFIWLFNKKQWIIPALLLLALSMPFIAPEPAKERVSYTFTQGRDRRDVVTIAGIKLDTSTSERLRSWKEASKDWIKHPIVGYGVTGYRFVDAQYVRVLVETGVLGLVMFLVLVLTIFTEGLRVLRTTSDPLHKGLCAGFLAGFVGLLFHAIGANTFIIVRIMEPFWFITAMVIMIPDLEKDEGI